MDVASTLAHSVDPDGDPLDDDLVLQRYNSHLPPIYRPTLDLEQRLLNRALHTLLLAITASPCATASPNPPQTPDVAPDTLVSESYQHAFERDLAALAKGVLRYLDLKHSFSEAEYGLFFPVLLRGALSRKIDMGLRSKLARCASRLISKRHFCLPNGYDWRPILTAIVQIHIDCADGKPYIGRDIRDSHFRNMVSLLTKAKNFLTPSDSPRNIWAHFAPDFHTHDFTTRFQAAIMLNYVFPTRGDAWAGWIEEGFEVWKSIPHCLDWDAIWLALFARMLRHQPGLHDVTPHLSWIYTRITAAFRLPLGPIAPQSTQDRRCPHHLYFLLDSKTTPLSASLIVHSLSPQFPEAMQYLRRLIALIANYFHPSNSGRWSSTIGSFLAHFTASLVSRATDEKNATQAGVLDYVLSSRTQRAIASQEHRLSEEYLQELVDLLLPLVQHGLYSKVGSLSLQAASAARDLAIIRPEQVIGPFLMQAADGLGSLSTPHRTTVALRLLSALTPIFLDTHYFPDGAEYLMQALELTLPGIDPNDPGKTESTLRFIAGASARIQRMVAGKQMPGIVDFLEGYVRLVLDRLFALLESLETPPKKHANGTYPSAGTPLSPFMFSVAIENLFGILPPDITISAATRIANQLTGTAHLNAKKYYAFLVRTAAAAAAAVSPNGTSAKLFVPPLIDALLDDDGESLVEAGEDELVWRMRMLAQAARCVGVGLREHLPKIATIIQLAFDRPKRPLYKAGGRLLRGVLEGMTSIQMVFGTGKGTEEDSIEDGGIYKFEWRTPEEEDWTESEKLVLKFIARAEELCTIEKDGTSKINVDRDVLFRVLRMLHAIQRGGRWLLGGALPNSFKQLDKYDDNEVEMTLKDATLILKRPIAAGFGGERPGNAGEEFATKTWARIYTLVSKIMEAVLKERPDDGALLYRTIEPIELAHEPFRRGERSRQVLLAASAYKSAYKPVIAAKRPFGAEGGVGRDMPRFIFKFRMEAHHEMRQSVGARGGMTNSDLCEKILHQLTDLALNDFPRVRGEARGVLTKTIRIVRPSVRRAEILRIVKVLQTSAPTANDSSESTDVGGNSDGDAMDIDNGVTTSVTNSNKKNDTLYEKMIGSSTILRSSAIAPVIMRDWSLVTDVIKALIESLPRAERPDGAKATTLLFAKLSSLVRPLGIEPIRLFEEDLETEVAVEPSAWEIEDGEKRLEAYDDLNSYLLSVLDTSSKTQSSSTETVSSKESGNEAHWRLQVFVATLLYIILREDRLPPAPVAHFFVQGMISDVVILRHICSRAVMLILSLHGNPNASAEPSGEQQPAKNSDAIATIGASICSESFARQLVHTLALDHDDEGGGRQRFASIQSAGGAVAFTQLSRTMDGDTCWMVAGGRPWPTSWSPRSRDSLSVVRIRFYEWFARVFGRTFYDSIIVTLKDLTQKIKGKKEKIISGVKEEDVKIVALDMLAGLCRGLDLSQCEDGVPVKELEELALTLLDELSGPSGNTNGSALIRFISTSEKTVVGTKVSEGVFNSLLASKPVIVPMGDGPSAQQQSRRLRYLYSSVADIDTADEPRMVQLAKESLPTLFSNVGFDHEMKTVREEVARCLSKLSLNVSEGNRDLFSTEVKNLIERLIKADEEKSETPNASSSEDGTVVQEGEQVVDEVKKSRSRQGETMSRFLSMVGWSGRSREFEQYVPQLLPILFSSFDESDPERITHARVAASIIAQGAYSPPVLDEVIGALEQIAEDERWKVRGSLLAFIQLLSFMSLFTRLCQQPGTHS